MKRIIAIADGTDVAVAGIDGKNWIQAILPIKQGWTALTFGAGECIAVGDSDIAALTKDGIMWTAIHLPGRGWSDIAFGNDRFVAIADHGRAVVVSNDGITWGRGVLPKTDAPEEIGWQSIAYGNGMFVAVDGRMHVALSADGLHWEVVELPPTTLAWVQVAFGNGVFVVIDGRQAATSADGRHWKSNEMPIGGRWLEVEFGAGVFGAPGYARNTLATSRDGVHWTFASLPPSTPYWKEFASAGNVCVVSPAPGDQMAWSADRVNWQSSQLPINAFWHVCGN